MKGKNKFFSSRKEKTNYNKSRIKTKEKENEKMNEEFNGTIGDKSFSTLVYEAQVK